VSVLTDRVAAVLVRDLRALGREIAAYPSDADVWRTAPGVPNSGGTLALHLTGNIQHFIGAVLGGSGYARNRDAEFARRDVPRAELQEEVERAIQAVQAGLSRLSDADLERDYPLPIAGRTVTTGDYLLHLATHFTYHLGQLDYHRRLSTGQAVTVGTVSPGELLSARLPSPA
jgi:uncharacterized damage-inducible protein DinB